MTASNLFVAAEAAYLFSDRAWFGPDQMMSGERGKIGVSQDHRMAIGCSGLVPLDATARFEAWLAEQPSQEAAMHGLAGLARAMVAVRTEWDPEELAEWGDDPGNGFGLTVAIWSQERDQAEGYVLYTADHPDRPQVPLWRPLGMRRSIMPLVPPELVPDVYLDPERDGLELVREQKRRGGHVGGTVDLATVTRDGVTLRAIGTCEEPRPRKGLVSRIFGR